MSNFVNSIPEWRPLIQAVAPRVDPYSVGVRNMASRAAKNETVSWDLFKWVVGGLLALICTLLAVYLSGIRDDIIALLKDVVDTKVDLLRSLGEIGRASCRERV